MTIHSIAETNQLAERDRLDATRKERSRRSAKRIEAALADMRAAKATADAMPPEHDEHDSRVADFFNGKPIHSEIVDFDTGGEPQMSDRTITNFERAMQVLDNLDDDTSAECITAGFYFGDCDNEDIAEKIYDVPTFVSRYEKCFTNVRALEAQLENANADQKPEILKELLEANTAWDIEKGRALNDRYRKFHLIDRHRAEGGRDDYNAARRTTRTTANTSLKDKSEDERNEHKLDQGALHSWKSSKRKAGWTAEQIGAEVVAWWEKRISKRTAF